VTYREVDLDAVVLDSAEEINKLMKINEKSR
jgi:hypothetical protein